MCNKKIKGSISINKSTGCPTFTLPTTIRKPYPIQIQLDYRS